MGESGTEGRDAEPEGTVAEGEVEETVTEQEQIKYPGGTSGGGDEEQIKYPGGTSGGGDEEQIKYPGSTSG